MQPENFTEKAQDAIAQAQALAAHAGQQAVELAHLVLALMRQDGGVVPPLCAKMAIDVDGAEASMMRLVDKLPKVTGAKPFVAPQMAEAMRQASLEADALNDSFISTEHLFLAAAKSATETGDALRKLGIVANSILLALKEVRGSHRVTDATPEARYMALGRYTRDLTEAARRGKSDPVIGRDEETRRVLQVLCRRSKNNPVLIGEPGVGKTAIIEGLARRIVDGDVPENMRHKKVLALDLAALVAGAKYRGEFEDRLKAVLKDVSDALGNIILFIDEMHTLVGAGAAEGAMDASNMLKPALARGELHCVGATTLNEYRKYIEKDAALERRFAPVLVEPPNINDTVSILRGLKERYEIHHGVRIQDAAIVAAATLSDRYITARFLPDKAIDLVDEAASNLRLQIDSLPSEIDQLNRKITQLEIERQALTKETDATSQARIIVLERQISGLKETQTSLGAQWQQEVAAIKASRDLKQEIENKRQEQLEAERRGELQIAAELKYGVLPMLSNQLHQANEKLEAKPFRMLHEEVSAENIAEVVTRWTGIPTARMLEGEMQKMLRIEDALRARVVGQDEALRAVADAVRRSRAGLADAKKPTGSFLFMGQSGVGKTETARALASFLFDDEQAMVRLDMSEYMEKHSVSRLIGAPPGYVGFDTGGQLTEAVRRRPYCVVLLDEIEKAHPEITNALLQVLDDGRLTDGQGRTVDFRQCVIIMTSNLGAQRLGQVHGPVDKATRQSIVNDALAEHFRPEFINRIDDVVVFAALTRDVLDKVLDIQLAFLQTRLQERGIGLTLSTQARDILVKTASDPAYGARPLKRLLQRRIANPLATQLLSGGIKDNDVIEALPGLEQDDAFIFVCKRQ